MAIVADLLFFVSLLLHELGHAVQARRDNVEIDGITLWLFGGVARFRNELPNAGAELRIAVAGPLVTLVLGLVFVAVAASASTTDVVDGVVAWLGYTNIALLVFNLLPALPLDGGRILRSLLWMRRGDLRRATAEAAIVARVFAYLLIGGGIALFVLEGAFSGAWLAFIGWFLLQAATAEMRWVAARTALSGLRVRDLMTPDPVVVDPALPIGRLVDEVVWNRRYTTYPVVDRGRPVGILPFRRVAEVPRAAWEERNVGQCMIPLAAVPVLAEDDDVADALEALQRSNVGRGLVVRDEQLVGLLSVTDIASALELRQLREQGRQGDH
jgi:Zn-dependent protease